MFSPDGQRLLTACRDDHARIWSLDGKLLLSVRHQGHMCGAAFSPSGEHFVTTIFERPEARVWRSDGTLIATCLTQQAGMGRASFSPDGTRFATSDKGSARVWSLDGAELAVLRGHGDFVSSVEYSSDGRFLLTASHDGTARLWHAREDDLLRLADERILRDFTQQEAKYLNINPHLMRWAFVLTAEVTAPLYLLMWIYLEEEPDELTAWSTR